MIESGLEGNERRPPAVDAPFEGLRPLFFRAKIKMGIIKGERS